MQDIPKTHVKRKKYISYAVLAESRSEKRANYSNMTMLMMTLLTTKIWLASWIWNKKSHAGKYIGSNLTVKYEQKELIPEIAAERCLAGFPNQLS